MHQYLDAESPKMQYFLKISVSSYFKNIYLHNIISLLNISYNMRHDEMNASKKIDEYVQRPLIPLHSAEVNKALT